MTSSTRRAVIAIGSNSTRMLTACADAALSSPVRGREETRLFLSLNGDKSFEKEARERLYAAILALQERARLAGAGEIKLIATSAVRDSRDAILLKAELLEKTGLELIILSGEEEARCSYLGAVFPYLNGGTQGVIDIGGGSTEIALGEGPEDALSLQLGASRLYRLCPIDQTTDLQAAYAAVETELDRALKPDFKHPDRWLMVGGTGVALMGLLKGELISEYHPGDEAFTLNEAEEVLIRLASLTPPERALLPGMTIGREHILPTGLVILTALMKRLQIDQMAVTVRNNCDGFLYDWYRRMNG